MREVIGVLAKRWLESHGYVVTRTLPPEPEFKPRAVHDAEVTDAQARLNAARLVGLELEADLMRRLGARSQ